MNFELKKYYYHDNNEQITNKEIVKKHLSECLKIIKWINENISFLEKEENVFPDINWEINKDMYYLTIGTLIIIFKITNNPVFMIESENFYNKSSFVTFDVFVHFLELLTFKLQSFENNEFIEEVNGLNNQISLYKENNDKQYNLNLSSLYRWNPELPINVTNIDDKIIKKNF